MQAVIAAFDVASISAQLEAPRAAAAVPQFAFATVAAQQQSLLDRLTAMRLGPGTGAAAVASAAPLRLAQTTSPATDSDTRPQLAQSVALTRDLTLSFAGGYAFGRNAGTATQVGFGYDTYLASVAIDARVAPSAIVGASLTFADGDATLDLGDGHTKLRNYVLSLYGTWFRGGAFVDGVVGASYDDYYDVSRATSFSFMPTATASPGGYSAYVAADSGYLFDLGEARVGPTAGIRYTHSAVDAYQETGARMLDLSVGGQNADSVVGSLGFEATAKLAVAGYEFSPYLRLGLEHEFANGTRTVTTSLANGLPAAITTQGPQGTDGRVATGVDLQVSPSTALALEFNSTFGGAVTDHLVEARLRVAW